MPMLLAGTLLHRHRVPLPEPDDCEFYTIEHLNVGRDLPLYGTIYHITSCDAFTRNFLAKLGVRVNPDSCIPSDPYMESRSDVSAGNKFLITCGEWGRGGGVNARRCKI